jgi:hypothetical protein
MATDLFASSIILYAGKKQLKGTLTLTEDALIFVSGQGWILLRRVHAYILDNITYLHTYKYAMHKYACIYPSIFP